MLTRSDCPGRGPRGRAAPTRSANSGPSGTEPTTCGALVAGRLVDRHVETLTSRRSPGPWPRSSPRTGPAATHWSCSVTGVSVLCGSTPPTRAAPAAAAARPRRPAAPTCVSFLMRTPHLRALRASLLAARIGRPRPSMRLHDSAPARGDETPDPASLGPDAAVTSASPARSAMYHGMTRRSTSDDDEVRDDRADRAEDDGRPGERRSCRRTSP